MVSGEIPLAPTLHPQELELEKKKRNSGNKVGKTVSEEVTNEVSWRVKGTLNM